MSEFNIEQLRELIKEVKNSGSVPAGSIDSCTARYGGERDSAIVEEFIAALTTFKLTENISDNEVITGMPMLLWGEAAMWWSGVKDNISNFESFVQKMREAFSPLKPAWRIYAEIFDYRQQKSEPTESFLRKKMALFGKLTKPPGEIEQIDIIYGLLHTQIKERVFRHRVVNFDELIKYAGEAEETLKTLTSLNTENSSTSGSVRCSHCRKRGHTGSKCLKKSQMEEEARRAAFAAIQATGANAILACYGCNAPGVVRSNCSHCKKMSANPLGSDIPIVNVQMFGVPGQAYIDTGARISVASANLKKIFDFYDCKFNENCAEVVSADGSRSMQVYLSTECKIVVGGTSFDTKFVFLPNTSLNRIHLGSDFLEQAGMVLNMGQRYWYFESDPSVHFEFEKALPLELNLLEAGNMANKDVNAESAGVCEERLKRKAVEELNNKPKQRQRDMSEFE